MDESGYSKYSHFMQRNGEGHRVIEWSDTDTSARGWLVMSALTNGAAGGGTRMTYKEGEPPAYYANLARFLAKTMEIKMQVAGPPIGGAKSVICYQPADAEDAESVLERWFERIDGELRARYGTGGDLGVDEKTVATLLKRRGVVHPQLGIAVGHHQATGERLDGIIENLNAGVALPVALDGVGRTLRVADLVTGRGVAEAVASFFSANGEDLRGKRVLVEGFGNVGAASAYYLDRAGAKVVGILCRDGERFRWHRDDDGLDVRALLNSEAAKRKVLPAAGSTASADDTAFWTIPADVFVPAADSFTTDVARLERLRSLGVVLIACGANNPFADRTPGSVDVLRQADEQFAVIPDFVANCGMARTFSYLMEPGAQADVTAIEKAVVATVRSAMRKLVDDGRRRGLVDRALQVFVPNG